MVFEASIIPIEIAIGAAAGAFSAFLGWNKSGEPFEPRKFVNGVVTGIIGGIALIIANATVIQGATGDQVWIQLAILVLAIVGVDQVRVTVSAAIANRANKEQKVEAK